MNTITITITGPQGSGKTTVAQAIAQLLADAGVEGTISDEGTPTEPVKPWASRPIVHLVRLARKTNFKVEVAS